MQKWIEATDAQWQAAFKRDVTDVHDAELNKVKLQYITALEDGTKKASAANDLKGALALRNEQKRFGETQVFPEKDEEGDAPAVKGIRAAIRVQLAKAEKDSAARAKALHAKYDQVLAQAQTQLTKAQRLDDAQLVQTKRDEVAAAWLIGGSAAPAAPAQPLPPAITPVAKPAVAAAGRAGLAGVTKERPFLNSLGMKFVPVPRAKVLFSIWDTRVKDYEAFAAANASQTPKPAFEQSPEHPVVMVNWNDAQSFCEWLTKHEIADGKLPKGMKYRLPTDLEWSAAVGLGSEAGGTPAARSGKIKKTYPWGKAWPPAAGAGNYSDDLNTDTFENTSPVGSFKPNEFGLYDMGGNAWQWCEDWLDSREQSRVLRGGSWKKNGPVMGNDGLLSSFRFAYPPTFRFDNFGFRVVLDLAAGQK